jgi:hypothetical protein
MIEGVVPIQVMAACTQDAPRPEQPGDWIVKARLRLDGTTSDASPVPVGALLWAQHERAGVGGDDGQVLWQQQLVRHIWALRQPQ